MVVDIQARETIEQTIKAGILEQGTVDLLCRTGVGDDTVSGLWTPFPQPRQRALPPDR